MSDIKAGDVCTTPDGNEAEVVAVDGGWTWVRYPSGGHCTYSARDLKRIPKTRKVVLWLVPRKSVWNTDGVTLDIWLIEPKSIPENAIGKPVRVEIEVEDA